MGMSIGSASRSKRPQVSPQMNVTPLVDVVLVLLIIFLIAVPVAIQTIEKLEIPIMVSAEAVNDENVRKALDFWTSVEGANAWSEASGNYAGNSNAAAPNPIISKISADMSEAGTSAIMRWWEATPSDLQGEFVAELNSFLLDPTMENAEGIMSRMQALNEDYWSSL